MGASVVLPELIPKDVAMELTMTGRVFTGSEALQLGLVTRLSDDPLAEAHRLAAEIATRSPDSTAAAKRLLDATYCETDDRRKLHLETALQRRLMGGWNQLACAAKGLGVPFMLTPGFLLRSEEWSEEADEKAEAELRAMLDA
jgi:enoyl-CoA hydratase/carnithine racemase